MDLNDPVIEDLKDDKDPFANVSGKDGGDIRAWITGSFPMGNNFVGLFKDDLVTLPTDWVALANVFAIDGLDAANPDPGDSPWRWDIHDDLADTEGHAGNPFLPVSGTGIDAVDNAVAGWFQYSTIYGGLTAFGGDVGLFDPVQAVRTLLSNGELNAYDTPMPSARVDFKIAKNTVDKGVKVDINGAGMLQSVLKIDRYSDDGAGGGNPTAHNLSAPYFATYLPATESPGTLDSGIAGPRHGNNFVGFLDNGRGRNVDLFDLPTLGSPFLNALQTIGDGLLASPYIYWLAGGAWVED